MSADLPREQAADAARAAIQARGTQRPRNESAAAPPGSHAPADAASPADHGASPLEGRHLRLNLGAFEIADLSVALKQGEVTAFVGPNGSGKTTLLRMLARLLRPNDGQVCIDGQAVATLSTRQIARELAILPQSPQTPAGVTVRELVAYGRHPHQGLFKKLRRQDRDAIDWAIHSVALEPLADRPVDSLSGGERQRAWIAMALAQQTHVLLLDEPTSYLDVRHQVETLSLVRDLNREHGLTVAWVLHDLNQAAAYSDSVAMLCDGRIVAHGSPDQVITSPLVHDVFGVEVTVARHPENGSPLLIPATTPCRCRTCIGCREFGSQAS